MKNQIIYKTRILLFLILIASCFAACNYDVQSANSGVSEGKNDLNIIKLSIKSVSGDQPNEYELSIITLSNLSTQPITFNDNFITIEYKISNHWFSLGYSIIPICSSFKKLPNIIKPQEELKICINIFGYTGNQNIPYRLFIESYGADDQGRKIPIRTQRDGFFREPFDKNLSTLSIRRNIEEAKYFAKSWSSDAYLAYIQISSSTDGFPPLLQINYQSKTKGTQEYSIGYFLNAGGTLTISEPDWGDSFIERKQLTWKDEYIDSSGIISISRKVNTDNLCLDLELSQGLQENSPNWHDYSGNACYSPLLIPKLINPINGNLIDSEN
jgi:hypothetical protein